MQGQSAFLIHDFAKNSFLSALLGCAAALSFGLPLSTSVHLDLDGTNGFDRAVLS
jgi:hypothetical protein